MVHRLFLNETPTKAPSTLMHNPTTYCVNMFQAWCTLAIYLKLSTVHGNHSLRGEIKETFPACDLFTFCIMTFLGNAGHLNSNDT